MREKRKRRIRQKDRGRGKEKKGRGEDQSWRRQVFTESYLCMKRGKVRDLKDLPGINNIP